MRRPLNQPFADVGRMECVCGRMATRQVPVVQLCYTARHPGGVRFVQWMPLCEACYALHRAVEGGATGKALAAAIAAHEQEMKGMEVMA